MLALAQLTVPEGLMAEGVILLGTAVQGSVGFGMNVVAAPLLLAVDSSFVPVATLCAGLAAAAVVMARDWRAINWSEVRWIFSGRLPGSAAGAYALLVLPIQGTRLLLGALLLLAVIGSAAGRLRLPRHAAMMVSLGFVSGFMGTTTSVGGPPIALTYQRESGPTVRGTLSALGLIGAVLSLGLLAATGQVHESSLVLGALLLPGLAAGLLISPHLATRLDSRLLRHVLLVIVALSAVSVIISVLQ